jgi:hypothetical protein
MALEQWEQDESKKEKTEKEKSRNRSMLTHERNGLEAMSLANGSEVTETPTDDFSTSTRGGVGESGFLSRYASDSAAMTLADTNLQLEREKNEGLRLMLQLEQVRERREMEAARQARDDRQQSEMRELTTRAKQALA